MNLYEYYADLRILLTANFEYFENGVMIIDDFILRWNGEEEKYEFELSNQFITIKIPYYGMANCIIPGDVRIGVEEDYVMGNLQFAMKSVNQYIIDKETFKDQ